MYKPFGKDVKDEMLRCIGYDLVKVKRNGRFRFFNALQNIRTVRNDNKIWQMLMRCGYAELICTQVNFAAKIAYSTYVLTKSGIDWLGRRLGLRIILPTLIRIEYKEDEIC